MSRPNPPDRSLVEAEVAEIDRAIVRLQDRRASLLTSLDSPSNLSLVRGVLRRSPHRSFVSSDLGRDAGLTPPQVATAVSFLLRRGEVLREPFDDPGRSRSRWCYRWWNSAVIPFPVPGQEDEDGDRAQGAS